MSMGGGTQRVVNELSPTQAPFVEYGLKEAQNLYQTADTPQFFPTDTFVGPSEQTQAALTAAQNRASMGSALTPASQQAFLDTIQGNYLSATNPYFQSRFNTAADAATQKYFDTVNQINSQASLAGRYGSGAQADLANRAQSNLAQALTNTAGDLAFDNYARERQNQLSTAQLAPDMASQDYADIDRMLKLGQISEGYSEMALEDAINRFNFEQNLPSLKLQQYLDAAYGAPMGTVGTQPVQKGGIMGALGGGLAGYGLSTATTAAGAPMFPFLASNPYLAPLALGILASQ